MTDESSTIEELRQEAQEAYQRLMNSIRQLESAVQQANGSEDLAQVIVDKLRRQMGGCDVSD